MKRETGRDVGHIVAGSPRIAAAFYEKVRYDLQISHSNKPFKPHTMATKSLHSCRTRIGASLPSTTPSLGLRSVATLANFKIPVINNEPNVSIALKKKPSC